MGRRNQVEMVPQKLYLVQNPTHRLISRPYSLTKTIRRWLRCGRNQLLPTTERSQRVNRRLWWRLPRAPSFSSPTRSTIVRWTSAAGARGEARFHAQFEYIRKALMILISFLISGFWIENHYRVAQTFTMTGAMTTMMMTATTRAP